jgi:hypothetical protein
MSTTMNMMTMTVKSAFALLVVVIVLRQQHEPHDKSCSSSCSGSRSIVVHGLSIRDSVIHTTRTAINIHKHHYHYPESLLVFPNRFSECILDDAGWIRWLDFIGRTKSIDDDTSVQYDFTTPPPSLPNIGNGGIDYHPPSSFVKYTTDHHGLMDIATESTTATTVVLGASPSASSSVLLLSSTSTEPAAATAALKAAVEVVGIDIRTGEKMMDFGINVFQSILIGGIILYIVIELIRIGTHKVLLPKGVQELEIQCKVFIPELWEDYQKQVRENGETLVDRPDLMYELAVQLNSAMEQTLLETINRHEDYNDLLVKYENQLWDDQQWKDRPDLMNALFRDIQDREVEAVSSLSSLSSNPDDTNSSTDDSDIDNDVRLMQLELYKDVSDLESKKGQWDDE